MEDIIKITEQLQSLSKLFGIVGLVFGIILLLSILFLYKYLVKTIEKSAELHQEKFLTQFKSELDKELQAFSVRFQQIINPKQMQSKKFTEIFIY